MTNRESMTRLYNGFLSYACTGQCHVSSFGKWYPVRQHLKNICLDCGQTLCKWVSIVFNEKSLELFCQKRGGVNSFRPSDHSQWHFSPQALFENSSIHKSNLSLQIWLNSQFKPSEQTHVIKISQQCFAKKFVHETKSNIF